MILSGFSLEEPFNLMYSFVFYLQNFSHRCYYVATRQLNKMPILVPLVPLNMPA